MPRDRIAFWRSNVFWVVVIGVLGLTLRLSFAREFAEHPSGRFPWVDENACWIWALK